MPYGKHTDGIDPHREVESGAVSAGHKQGKGGSSAPGHELAGAGGGRSVRGSRDCGAGSAALLPGAPGGRTGDRAIRSSPVPALGVQPRQRRHRSARTHPAE